MSKTKKLKNKEMNTQTYKLRKEAMKFVYEAKLLDPTLPRITVRITDNADTILGMARFNKNIIWIVEKSITKNQYDLRTVVFHEILHAVYGIHHDESCPLMKAIHSPLSKRDCEYHFKKWIKRSQTIESKAA